MSTLRFQIKQQDFIKFLNEIVKYETDKSFQKNWDGVKWFQDPLPSKAFHFYLTGKDGRENIINDLPEDLQKKITDKFHELFD